MSVCVCVCVCLCEGACKYSPFYYFRCLLVGGLLADSRTFESLLTSMAKYLNTCISEKSGSGSSSFRSKAR